MESPYFLILVFSILLLIFPFSFGVKIDYSKDKNFGVLNLKILKKNINFLKFKFENFGLVIYTKKQKKLIKLNFEVDKRKLIFFENLFFQFKDKVKIKYMAFHSKVGTLDAFKTAMIIGGINQVFYTLFSYLKNDKQTATIIIKSIPEWNRETFEISLCFNLAISIYEFLYCIIFANLRARRVK